MVHRKITQGFIKNPTLSWPVLSLTSWEQDGSHGGTPACATHSRLEGKCQKKKKQKRFIVTNTICFIDSDWLKGIQSGQGLWLCQNTGPTLWGTDSIPKEFCRFLCTTWLNAADRKKSPDKPGLEKDLYVGMTLRGGFLNHIPQVYSLINLIFIFIDSFLGQSASIQFLFLPETLRFFPFSRIDQP